MATEFGTWIKAPRDQLKIFYMLENHTFLPLSLCVIVALEQIRSVWNAGHTHGMLGSQLLGTPIPVSARGDWDQFEKEVYDYYGQLSRLKFIGEEI